MPFYTELDVVNECLASASELPLNSLDDEHPLLASALASLRAANMREQAKGWWFNKELTKLNPDATSGYISIPADTIRLDPTDESLNYVQRGNKLYQPYADSATDKFKFTQPVACWLTRLLAFEDLPVTAQDFVRVSAVLDFQKDFDGDPQRKQDLKDEYKAAYITLNSEHIRNVNANRLRNPSLQRKLMGIAPTMPSSYGRYA
jgi:hypothetical protein